MPEPERAAPVACPEHDPHPQRDGTEWCPNCPTGLGASDGTSKSTAAPVAHPDPEIAAEIQADALAAEMADLAAGYPPRRWTCPCGASHSRGVQPNGGHRCLACGYIGTGGTLAIAQGESDV